jgi:diguanylate cyclase (GGDEF)-like protein/PAS domain S-box-containing protein
MAKKPTPEELKQRITELEKAAQRSSVWNINGKSRILFENFKDAILIIKNEKFIDCNQAAIDMLGYKNKSEVLQTHPSELSPDKQSDGQNSFTKAKKLIDLALKNGSNRFEWDHIRANGEIFPVEVLLTTISPQEGNQVLHTIWRDITHRKSAEKERQKEKETLSIILESTPHGITFIDNHDKYLYVNPYFTKITGYVLEDIPTREDWFKRAYPDKNYRKKVIQVWGADRNQTGQGKSREFKIKCKTGQSKHIEFRSSFLKDGKISVLTDVTQRRQAEKALRDREEKLKAILFATPDPIIIYGIQGETEYLNPAFIDLFGWSLDELQGKRVPFVPEDEKQITSEYLKELLSSGKKVQFETKRLTKQGRSINVIVSTSCIKNLNGEISKLVVILTDITNQRQAKKELKLLNLKLKYEATHDPLTGGLNRRAILDKLSKELIRAKRANTNLSIGLCDIDHFKKVNDQHGHQVGDDVLCSFVKIIQNALRPYDLVGRYGGEEFLLVIPNSSGLPKEKVYERMRAKIANHKMATRSGDIGITISIGITSSTGYETADEMLAAADAALYTAKENGRNQLAFADPVTQMFSTSYPPN